MISIDEKQEFLAGYGITDDQVAVMAPLLKALNIINYAPYIERFGADNNTAQLDQ